MVRHVVFFKLKNSTISEKEAVKNSIEKLKDKIDVIKFYQVGINFSNEQRAYDLALISDFETKEDLKIYAKHPEHLKVINSLKSKNITTKVVDFEY